MTLFRAFFQENKLLTTLPSSLYVKYPHITTDAGVHSGLPHIKNTRILTSDVFRAQIQGYSLNQMLMEFKEIGVPVSKQELEEAIGFTIELLNIFNEKDSSKRAK